MPQVVALYRYPVKGFTPEPRESLTVLPNGRVRGDRVLAFRYADAPAPDGEGWMPKINYAVLSHTPGIARAKLRFDEAAGSLRIEFPDGRVVAERLDPEGRQKLAQAVGVFAIAQRYGPLHGHPEKLPLQLVGNLDGQHFHDSAAGRVTLFSRASLGALGGALDDPDLDERRFRANIVIDGVDEWAELAWPGRKVRIGHPGVEFEVAKTVGRCVATHANPVTGEHDCDVLNTLTRVFGHEKPTFAVSMQAASGGEIKAGDEVTVS